VIVHYWLKEKPEGEVKISILDAGGQVIRESSSTATDPPRAPAQPGANRFVWDLRYAGPARLEDRPNLDPQRVQAEATGTAPRALPGSYQVRLTIGDSVQTQPISLLPDPRLPVTADDLAAQFALKLAIRDQLSVVHGLLNQIQRVRKQVDEWEARLKARQPAGGSAEPLTAAATALRDRLAALEGDLLLVEPDKPQPAPNKLKEKLATLSSMIDESDHPPTRGATELFASLSAQAADARSRLDQIIAEDVARYVTLIQEAGIPPIVT